MPSIYGNTLIPLTTTIGAGESESSIINCVNTPTGMTSIRRITFRTGWTTCGISFKIFETINPLDDNPTILAITDSSITTDLIIPNCTAARTITLPAPWLDSAAYLSLICDVPQAEMATVTLWCQPIYQGGT